MNKTKPVVCVDAGKLFESLTAAGKAKSIDPACISMCARGTLGTSGGLRWRFATPCETKTGLAGDFDIERRPQRVHYGENAMCVETGEVYESMSAAARAKGLFGPIYIGSVIGKPSRTAAGCPCGVESPPDSPRTTHHFPAPPFGAARYKSSSLHPRRSAAHQSTVWTTQALAPMRDGRHKKERGKTMELTVADEDLSEYLDEETMDIIKKKGLSGQVLEAARKCLWDSLDGTDLLGDCIYRNAGESAYGFNCGVNRASAPMGR